MKTLYFDGFGINGDDIYKSRLATLTRLGQETHIWPLVVSSYNFHAAQSNRIIQLQEALRNTLSCAEYALQVMPDIPQNSNYRETVREARETLSKT